MTDWTEIDPAFPERYPPNIQAILKQPAPASALLGIELLALNADEGAARAAFNAGPSLCNKWGALQGGMVAAMLDDLMSIAAGLTLEWGQIVPTLEMKSSFLSPAPPGRLIGMGRVVKRGASVVFLEARLEDLDGALLATGSGTARIVTRK
jgi:uncharacterized protein (TIGR00369 family)